MDIKPLAYRQKLIRSGDLIEIYNYEKAIKINHKRKKRQRKTKPKELEVEESEEDKNNKEYQRSIRNEFSFRRTRANIVRLVNSNPELKVFITLTFDDKKSNDGSFTDITKCNLIFSNFIKRLKRHYPDLRYLAVPEFQGDYYFHSKIKKEFGGNIHYHILSNLPYTANAKLADIWKFGFVKINNVRHVSRIGLYVAKYIGKELFDGRLAGKKKIFYSRQLIKPEVLIGIKAREYFNSLKSPSELLLDKQYHSDYVGEVRYRLFKNQ
ncbi:MAG: hypothetical protein PHG03_05445 [Bacilli bacterium]|nr:hypothetical protein [Bacilli bacterium]